jgi:hypothetical protein
MATDDEIWAHLVARWCKETAMGKKRGEGPYHNNEHKDGPDGGNKTSPAQGTSVKQGRSQGEYRVDH